MKQPQTSPVLALALAVLLSMSGCGGKTPEESLRQGRYLLEKGESQGAIIALKNVLQAQPSNAEARLLLGQIQLANFAFPEAVKELEQAREHGAPEEQVLPNLARAYLGTGEPQKVIDLGIPTHKFGSTERSSLYVARATAQFGLGKDTEAVQSLSAAEEADARNPDLLLLQVKLAISRKDKAKALELVESGLRKNPQHVDTLYLKAAILAQDSKADEALQVYRQIIVHDPRQFRAHLAISSLLLKKNDIDSADKAVQAAEKAAGPTPIVKYARASLEIRRGSFDKANAAFTDLLKNAPEHVPSLLAHAFVNAFLGNYEQSMKSAGKVLGMDKNNLLAARLLATGQLKTGDPKAALNTVAPFLSKHDRDAKLLALVGEAYLKIQDYNQAMLYLDRAATLEPEDAAIRTRLAVGHLAVGDNLEALANLEKAASLSERAGQADLALVLLHMKAKSFDKALQAISLLEKKEPSNPVIHNLRAAALLSKWDRAGARKSLEQALALKPDFLPAAIGLAKMDQEDNKPEAARKRFEAILSIDKNNLQAQLALADLAIANKQERDFLGWLDKATKAHPSALLPRQRLVDHYLRTSNAKQAMASATEAYNVNPDEPEFINLLGGTQVATGDLNGAIRTYYRLVNKEKGSADALTKLAVAQATNKQLAQARSSLDRAIKLKPDHLQALDTQLRVELADKKIDVALQLARTIQASHPQSSIGFDREGDILLAQKKVDLAVRAYDQALNRRQDPTTLLKIYRAYLLARDFNRADQRLTSWLNTHPDDEAMRLFAASQYMKAGRNRQAITVYEGMLQKTPNHLVALNNLASLYHQEKDGRAQPVAERALKLAPDNPAVRDTLGWILVAQGQAIKGLDLLRSAAALAPNNSTIRYHHGAALTKVGKRSDARRELEAALASEPNFPEATAARSLLKTL